MSSSVHFSYSLLSSDLSISSFINMDSYKCHFDLNWLFLLLLFNSLIMDVLRLWSTFFVQSGLVPSDSTATLKALCFFFFFEEIGACTVRKAPVLLYNAEKQFLFLDTKRFLLEFNRLQLTGVNFVRPFGLDACNESWHVVPVSIWLTQRSVTSVKGSTFINSFHKTKFLFRSLPPT